MTKMVTMPDTRFGGLSEKEWNALAGEHFYSTANWQRFCTAETQTDGDSIVSYDGGEVAWAVPVRELAGLAEWSSYRWNDHLSRFNLPTLTAEGLLIGPPEGFQTHLLAGGRRDPETLRGLVDTVRQQCGNGSRSAVVMFANTADARLLTAAGVRHLPVLLETDAWLAVPAGGWDGYLASFPKKRRRNIRTARQNFADAGLVVTHTELGKCWTTLGDAAAATLNKYGHSTTAEIELVSMRRVVDVLGVQAKVAVCHPDGAFAEPLGFCIYYEHAKTVFIRWIGFDTSKLRDVEEYYNTLFYTQIERAESAGIRWIHAGATTPAAKALRGAELRPLWLLDLTANSPLDGAGDAIIEHNYSMLDELHADPRTTKAVAPAEDWTAFG